MNQKIENKFKNSENIGIFSILFFRPCGENDGSLYSDLNMERGKEFVKTGKYAIKGINSDQSVRQILPINE